MKPNRLLISALVLVVLCMTAIASRNASPVVAQSSDVLSGAVDTFLPLVYTAAPTPTPLPRCNAFNDDFSTNQYWPTGENAAIRVGYVNGEYSFATRQVGSFILRAPEEAGAYANNYSVETDIRWEGTLGDSYGLAYGIDSGFDNFFLFDMNTEFQGYRVIQVIGDQSIELVPITSSSAINAGNGVNRLEVDVSGTTHTFSVNGVELASAEVPASPLPLETGILVGSNPDAPSVSARFDNYCITVSQGAGSPVNRPSTTNEVDFQAVTVPTFGN